MARFVGEDQEIKRYRIEQQTRQAAPEMQRDPDDRADGDAGAAFAALRPGLGFAHAGVSPRRRTPLTAISPAARAQEKCVSAPLFSHCTRSRSPGRTGRRNLALWIATLGAPAPRDTVSTIASSNSAPGRIGLPGKWPAAVGWSAGKTRSALSVKGIPHENRFDPARAARKAASRV